MKRELPVAVVCRSGTMSGQAAKRLVKAPKVFLPDSGLLAHLTGHTADTLATAPGLPGALVETFVCAELLKHLAFSARGLSLWHYRTQTGIEVDFLLEDRHGKLTGIEVKAAATVDGKDFKGLRHLQETEPERFQRGINLLWQRAFLEQLSGSIGIVLNTIEATMRTEHLLSQSQQLAKELQSQQTELQQTNEEIALKATLLAEQKAEVEQKNLQIEQARRALEEKAAELALTSRYKSEFLANMSHELRTPLNSILILGQQLAENPESNLSNRQIEFAKTIHAAGTDLLHLISDILDLSKIESGTVTVESEELRFTHLRENLVRGFRHEAERRQLDFSVEVDPALGNSLSTDPKRLQQILKNLLSNAFKFTEQGSVRLRVFPAKRGWHPDHDVLSQVPMVVAFEVTDTGIGISPEKQKIVFEAFQQADAGTSRKYGGTGLGLAISKLLAELMGGTMWAESGGPGQGSTFHFTIGNKPTELPTGTRRDFIGEQPSAQCSVRLVEHLLERHLTNVS